MQKSQEARVRAFAQDLLAILERRDRQVLKQAAALAAVPPRRRTGEDPRITKNVAREVAHGRIVMPAMPLGDAEERERMLGYREAMREGAGNDSFDFMGQIQFNKEERVRWQSAGEMLKRGLSDGDVAAKCHLLPDEVLEIRRQLKI